MPLAKVIAERPDVFNHNVEVVPRLYPVARRGSRWQRSLRVLRNALEMGEGEVVTKSGLMVGLGETHDEMVEAFGDLREAGVSILTVGQYLRPTERHLPVVRYWEPEEFTALERAAYDLGFEHIAAGPLVRSSYHADEHVAQDTPGHRARSPPARRCSRCATTSRRRGRRSSRTCSSRPTSSSTSSGRRAASRPATGATRTTCASCRTGRRSRTSSRIRATQRAMIATRQCGAPTTRRTYATPFTAMFMHGGLLHLGGNMLFLWIFGNNVEDSMGPVKFVIFYVLGGLAATGAARRPPTPSSQIPTLGASGAIAAVLGGYLLLFPRARVVTVIFIVFFFTILELPALLVLGLWFLQQALFGYFDLTGRARAASRTSPTSAASSSACSRSASSRAANASSARPPFARSLMPYRCMAAGAARRLRAGCSCAVAGALVRARDARSPEPAPAGAEAPPGPLLDSETAPLAGGGTAPSPLAVRLDDPRDSVQIRFKRPPRSALLFDLDTGRVLWRRDPTRVLPIASLTKMMTALVVAERDAARARRCASPTRRCATSGSGVGMFPRGRWIGVNTMLHGLLLPSGNDAAIALAQRAAGGSVNALRALHEREGATSSGSSARGSRRRAGSSTAATTRARATSRRSRAPCCASRGWRGSCAAARPCCRSRSRAGGCTSTTTTRCCAWAIRGTTGLKTGYTDAAGRCLVATARRGPIKLGVVLLHSPDPGKQAMQLLDRGFRASSA